MLIQINDKWRVRTDRHEFILDRRGEEKDPKPGDKPRQSDGWRAEAYCANLNEVLDVFLKRSVFAIEGEYPSEAIGILVDHMETIRADIRGVLAHD